MPPTAKKRKRGGDQRKTENLHVQRGTKGAGATSGKPGQEIGAAPTEGGEQAEKDAHCRLDGLALRRREAEFGHHFLQVFPDFALGAGIAKQVRGVVSSHELAAAKIKPLAAELRDA